MLNPDPSAIAAQESSHEISECVSIASSVTRKQAPSVASTVLSKEKSNQEYEFKNDLEGVDETEDLPDGGYGWFVVLGTFMTQFTSFGTSACWGILQDYLDVNMFQNKTTNSQFKLSFVGTLLEVCTTLCGPLAQIISSQFGTKTVLIIGTILATLGLELASLGTELWHFYLTVGVMFGCGASLLFVTGMGTTPLWFNKRRGIATGIASGGTGIGGVILPFVITPLNESLGIAWTFRIMGFICLVCDVIACVFVKDKVSVKKQAGERSLKHIFDFSILKDINFLLWTCGSVISIMGYFIPFFFLPAYATYLGLSASQSSALIAVMSACSFIGRILVGYIGDRIGRLNANIIFTFCCSLTNFLIWTFAYSYGSLMAYSALFGLFCASYFAMMTTITAAILSPEQYRTGVSTLLLSNTVSVLGITIAGAVEASLKNTEPYFSYKMFTGVVYLVGGIILVALKIRIKGLFAKF
ncbi:major facilitator superfamily domain-containing protein [Gilbertella persicaria]|uniref:major facilitator superfamily domain-containing protein n=1 Tax=Gilbertella persicaria TaxID=101096 RepID=UPI00221EE3A2|nr:major facilitator superfamily domain-containing protein [Gilbertella persicaria]KAI8053174.1 major facilitator superfamily domain-containing protein [Gilbertella persicaria]